MKSHLRPSTLALCAVLLLTACGSSPSELTVQAKAEFAAHDYRAARSYIVEALKSEPENRDMLLLHARILLALGDGSGAGAVLDRLAAKGPRTDQLAELSAEAALLRDQPAAVADYLKGVDSTEAERLRALAALRQNDMKAAADHFDRSVALGGNVRVFTDVARFRMMHGDSAGAQDMLAEAEKLGPDDIDTLLTGADFVAKRGDLAAPLDRFTKARVRYPSNAAALAGEAAVLGDLGRTDEMEKRIAAMDAAGMTGLDITWLKARLARSRSDWGKVRDIVQPLDASLPAGHPLRIVYAEALARLELAPQNASVLDTAGWVTFRTGSDRAEALRLLRAAAEKAPGNSAIRQHLAQAGG